MSNHSALTTSGFPATTRGWTSPTCTRSGQRRTGQDGADHRLQPDGQAPGRNALDGDHRPEFHPAAVYRINVDNDGDAMADVASRSPSPSYERRANRDRLLRHRRRRSRARTAGQVLTSSVPVSFGTSAQPIQSGQIQLLTGARSDPDLADVEGALHGCRWTRRDDFAGNNVLSIAQRYRTTSSAPTQR